MVLHPSVFLSLPILEVERDLRTHLRSQALANLHHVYMCKCEYTRVKENAGWIFTPLRGDFKLH